MTRISLATPIALCALLLASPAFAQGNAALCDLHAASSADEARPEGVAGVPYGEIVLALAEVPCRAAFAETGLPRHAFQLGRVLDQMGDDAGALAAYRAAVEGNYNAAQVNLGLLEVRMAYASAARRDQLAADGGSLVALYNLAIDYRDGLGVDADPAKAMRLFAEAAARGDADAAYDLALIYDEGISVLEDKVRAAALYGQAVAGGHVWAMVNLGLMLRDGDGVPADAARAAALFEEAYEAGDAESGVLLGLMLQHDASLSTRNATALLLEGLAARDTVLGSVLVNDQDMLAPASVEAIEAALAEAGVFVGTPDPVLDAETVRAVRAFFAA